MLEGVISDLEIYFINHESFRMKSQDLQFLGANFGSNPYYNCNNKIVS